MKKSILLYSILLIAGATFLFGQDSGANNPLDKSYTVEEYIELGISSPYNMWRGDDYLQALKVFSKLKETQPESLPRLYSPRSTKLFQRIADYDNYMFLADPDFNLDTKTEELQTFSLYYKDLLFLYISDTEKQIYGSEVLELFLFGLEIQRLTVKMLTDLTGLSPEIPVDSPDGFAEIREGLAQSLEGSLSTLELTQSYNIEDLKPFCSRLKDLIVIFWHWLNEVDKENFSNKIEVFSKTHDIPEIRNDMTLLIDKLNIK